MKTDQMIKMGLWIGGALMVLVALGFAERSHDSTNCERVKVSMTGNQTMQFISEQDLHRKVLDMGNDVIGAQLGDLDLPRIEQNLRNIPYLRDANVYHTMDGTLHVRVDQRTPVVRVLCNDGSSYYIDKKGWTMPLSNEHTARVLVVTGATETIDPEHPVGSVLDNDSLMAASVKDDIHRMASVISNDEFWNAMIDQAVVDADGEFTLIPRIGQQRLLVGNGTDLEARLAKLKEFYKKGIPMSGWRKYEKIDLRFADQVVCTKKKTY